MKLNLLFGGLLIMMLMAMQMHLPASAPILIIAVVAVGYIGYGYTRVFVVALYRTVKHFTVDRARALAQTAKNLEIREEIEHLKRHGYGHGPTHVLNARSAEYEDLFRKLARVLPYDPSTTQPFELKTMLDPISANRILISIKANTQPAAEALTELKNQLLKSGKSNISFS